MDTTSKVRPGQPDELPPYSASAYCPACGLGSVETTWLPPVHEFIGPGRPGPVIQPAALLRTCRGCGRPWFEAPLDAGGTP